MQKNWDIIRAELSAPFADDEISYKPGAIAKDGTRALAMAHVDARAVMERLDTVVGPDNWSDKYRVVDMGKDGIGVICELTVMGITKSDVGTPSDFESTKGGFSDALKRAAVKFGIARYLYDMKGNWLSWDRSLKGGKGDFVELPKEHWRLAGLESRHPQYPAGVEVMTDVDFYEFFLEVKDFVTELEAEVDTVNFGTLVDGILEKTPYYKSQNELLSKLLAAKDNGDLGWLAGVTIAGATNLTFEQALDIAMYLMGARATLR